MERKRFKFGGSVGPGRAWRLACVGFFCVAGGLVPGGSDLIRSAAAADYETLMREGVALRRAGDDASALKRFQQAYELNATPKALAQVGLAEQALGRWAAADTHLRQAIEWPDDVWVLKNRTTIDAALDVIAGHVGRLEVRGAPVGAEVRVDGELVGRLPLSRPITVTGGEVAVQVRAPGHLTIARVATITARTLTRESFDLQPLGTGAGRRRAPIPDDGGAAARETSSRKSRGDTPADPATSPARPAEAGSSRRALILAASGLALGSAAFGIFEHWRWQDKVSGFGSMSACGAGFPDRGGPGCNQLYEDGGRARTLALVGYGLTAAFTVTAVILLLTDTSDGGEPRKIACAPTWSGSGLACAMRF